MSKVSVIIPIFRVEKFIERCAISLFEQTLDSIEYIFVDDTTPDKSIEILTDVLERYPQRKPQVTILRHDVNKGLPAARNSGLSVAGGEYVFHCDSDDYLESNALEQMLNVAEKTDSDIVWCDYYLSFSMNERIMVQPNYSNSQEAIKGMLSGTMKYNVWNKLAKRRLYVNNSISFPAGHSMGEDMTMIKLFAHAKKVAYINAPLYHYIRLNTDAMTQSYSERKIADIEFNVAQTLDYLLKNCKFDLTQEFAFFKLSTKLPLLISDKICNYRIWNELYPEANKYILKNKKQSVRIRVLQWLASKKVYSFVKLYNIILNKLIYGLLYK